MGAGQTACCAAKDNEGQCDTAELSKAEAVPVVDESDSPGLVPASPTSVAEKRRAGSKEAADDGGTYTVTLDKASGSKLGMDVDYMPERRVLPIMSVTGGLAEEWNRNNSAQIQKGDGIVEVNGVRGLVSVMLEKCKTEQVLNLLVARNFTYDHMVADLEKLISTKECGPILIRLSWHDAGVYAEGKGGCPNAAMRFTDSGEGQFAANAGLPTVALSLLKPISDKYCPALISEADLWALAANVAIRLMGGPSIATRFGRLDAKSSAESVPSQEGRLPDGDKGADHLRAIFHAKGFDDKAIVALSGAHTVGKCHLDRSGFDGPWTEQPLKFDNSYFKELLAKSFSPETTEKGCPQNRHGPSGTMMLHTDLALMRDSSFQVFVRNYAQDEKLWFNDFTQAWTKLQENGLEGLRDVL